MDATRYIVQGSGGNFIVFTDPEDTRQYDKVLEVSMSNELAGLIDGIQIGYSNVQDMCAAQWEAVGLPRDIDQSLIDDEFIEIFEETFDDQEVEDIEKKYGLQG